MGCEHVVPVSRIPQASLARRGQSGCARGESQRIAAVDLFDCSSAPGRIGGGRATWLSSGCAKGSPRELRAPISSTVLAAMISLRRALVGRRKARLGVWWASLIGMAIGLLFALEGVWVAAIPSVAVAVGATWLVGAWVLPWTRDAYLRRVMRIWRHWASQTQWCNVQSVRTRAKFVRGVRALQPPVELRGQHERLVSLLEERDRLARQSPRTPALMSEMTVAQRSAREVKEKLIAESTLGSHRPYAVALNRLFATAQEDYVEMAAKSEAATESALRAVERITPPSTVGTEHALLTAGLREHLDVARRFHAATRAADPKGVEAAAMEWEGSNNRLWDLLSSVGDHLEYRQRWPVPSVEPPATDAKRG